VEILKRINNPSDLKKLNISELHKVCDELREYLIECCAHNPGHVASSLGAVELAVALHYVYDTPEDKLVWDVGHQAYAHKILTGRREAFVNNRKYKGISGFPKISESEYDAFGVGHSSTSISAALGMSVAFTLQGKNNKVVAIIGDGAMTGGLAFEGLNNAGAMKSDILVILNDNGISIDPNVGALHNYLLKISTSRTYNRFKNKIWELVGSNRLRKFFQKIIFSTKMAFFKSGSIFESLGFRYFGAIDGNNLDQLITTLSNLKEIKGPKLLHIVTTKGKGYKPAEDNQIEWHAPGAFDIDTGAILKNPAEKRTKFQDVFGETIVKLARENKKIVGITPAMPTGCSLNLMMKEFPERAFDVGIAEQHAVTFSAGLASQGMLPFCNIYSSFMQRAYDNVIHDVAIQNLKVIFCLDRSGFVGEDGATHHGAFDLAFFRCIPNLTIAAPMNEVDFKDMLYSATLPDYGATVIRYPRGYGEGVDWRGEFNKIEPGKAKIVIDGKGIALLTIGTAGNNAARAAARAREMGIQVLHYDMRFLKPVDVSALEDASAKCRNIITVEDGTIIGGLYSSVCEFIASRKSGIKVIGMGIPDRFVEQGTIAELQKECNFDEESIFKMIIDVAQQTS